MIGQIFGFAVIIAAVAFVVKELRKETCDPGMPNREGDAKILDFCANDPHFNVWALCLDCKQRWIGTVHYSTSLFTLVCPRCNRENSFASIIPDDYSEAHGV